MLPVCAGGDAVGTFEGPGEGFVRGKAVVQGNVQQGTAVVPHLLQGEGQFPAEQVVAKGHAGNFPEFPGGVVLRVAQGAGQGPQGRGLAVVAGQTGVDLIYDHLNLPLPFVHTDTSASTVLEKV